MKLKLPYDYLLLSQCPFRRKETHRKVCLFSGGGGRIRFSAKRHIQTGEGEDGFGAIAPNGSKSMCHSRRAGSEQGSTGALHLIIRIRPQYKKSNTGWCWTFCGSIELNVYFDLVLEAVKKRYPLRHNSLVTFPIIKK